MFKAFIVTVLLFAVHSGSLRAQVTAASAAKGSQTAKAGFKNEDEIRDKFNSWQTDADARAWLEAMNYNLAYIESVKAAKPHGEKADVVVGVRLRSAREGKDAKEETAHAVERVEGISIKLVSSPNGFNQIDKRWLANYAAKWKMPTDVVAVLKWYLGEARPSKPSRNAKRMFLDEMEPGHQKVVSTSSLRTKR